MGSKNVLASSINNESDQTSVGITILKADVPPSPPEPTPPSPIIHHNKVFPDRKGFFPKTGNMLTHSLELGGVCLIVLMLPLLFYVNFQRKKGITIEK